jgi:broad specificity phosphatase PhoE
VFNTVRIKRGQTLGAVYITRHGQAKTGARDHDDYDKLSTLGHQQAQWLGEFLAMQGNKFDRIYSGSLCRQQQTAQGINIFGALHLIDERLNEFDYFGLSHDLETRIGIRYPETQEAFKEYLLKMIILWKNGEVAANLETYENFHDRILSVVHDLSERGENALLVSSSGVIASLVARLLNVPLRDQPKLFLSVSHTCLNRFEPICGDLAPTLFCATPHLDHPNRLHARTFI